jgi:hypothetical protein
MTAVLASDIMDRSRVALNDQGANLYTNTTLLPVLKIVNDELCDKLISGGMQNLKSTGSGDITLPAGSTIFSAPPDDMIVPIELFEKRVGDDDSGFTPIIEQSWLDNVVPSTNLGIWRWSGSEIEFVGATEDRVVRIRYYRVITEITADNSPAEVIRSFNFLAFRTAELAAKNIGENPVKAADIMIDRKMYEFLLMQILNKNKQGVRVRRQAFRLPRRRIV